MKEPVQQIEFDEPLHSIGERLHVPTFALRQALAWSIGAELVRRHPGQLRLIEVLPHQYGPAVAPWSPGAGRDFGRTLGVLTLGAGMHITPFTTGWDRGRFNWLDVLLAENRRKYVVHQLESLFGLTTPTKTPVSQPSSIGYRAIAAFLERTALGADRWVINGGAREDDDDVSADQTMFDAMPAVKGDISNHDPLTHPWHLVESRYWFGCPIHKGTPQPPTFAVDVVDGVVWRGTEATDLMGSYQARNHQLDAVVSHTFPPAF